MKTLACVLQTSLVGLALLVSSTAVFAGTETLPEPTVYAISGAFCAAYLTPNDTQTTYTRQAITGWSAGGTQVFAKTYGSFPCGNRYGGRGITYYHWCGTFTWTVNFDALGTLKPIAVATYTPDPTQCAAPNYYGTWDWTATFYNAIGYGATVTPEPLVYGYERGVATLLTP